MVGTASPLRSCLSHSGASVAPPQLCSQQLRQAQWPIQAHTRALAQGWGGWAQDLARVPGCDALGFGRRRQAVPCVPGAGDICGMVRADAHLARHPEDSRPKTWGPGLLTLWEQLGLATLHPGISPWDQPHGAPLFSQPLQAGFLFLSQRTTRLVEQSPCLTFQVTALSLTLSLALSRSLE